MRRGIPGRLDGVGDLAAIVPEHDPAETGDGSRHSLRIQVMLIEMVTADFRRPGPGIAPSTGANLISFSRSGLAEGQRQLCFFVPLGAGHDGFAGWPGANELQQEVALGIGAERQARLGSLANRVAAALAMAWASSIVVAIGASQ